MIVPAGTQDGVGSDTSGSDTGPIIVIGVRGAPRVSQRMGFTIFFLLAVQMFVVIVEFKQTSLEPPARTFS
jgi:type IV secretory pathway TrbL component